MPQTIHGGDLTSAQAVYGGGILDCSANLNPLGMPEAVRQAAAGADFVHYPDPLCRALRAGIAARDGVERDWVCCGNGAAELIFRLALALRPGRALLCAPTFSEYEAALSCVGCAVERHTLRPEDRFDVTGAILDAVTGEVDLVVLCSPNNPTGRRVPPALLEALLDRCARTGARLLVDECFLELSDGGGPGLAPYLGRYPGLILLRAFTKSYAMAGLRLGYCLTADGALAEALARCGQPWGVSAPAQAAGLAALDCPDWPARGQALIARARPGLEAGLAALGLEVCPGRANFLLFRAPGRADLHHRLLGRGVLIRPCADFPGLGAEYYRVCVGREAANRRLLGALEEVLTDG